jgi:hypothetical protein
MSKRWVAPPTWPQPPKGWTPPPGWQPDPQWGPAPEGWQFLQTDMDARQRANTRTLKVVGVGTGLLLLLALVGVIGDAVSGSSSDRPPVANTPAAAAPIAPTPSPPSSAPSSRPSPPAPKGIAWPHEAIPGAAASDVIQGVARFGLSDFNRRDYDSPELPDGFSREAGRTDADTGARLNTRIVQDDEQGVREVECTITGTQSLAGAFLSFCGSLPYDDAQPSVAAAWVRQQLDVVRAGNPRERTFGGAHFLVAGGPSAKFVTITGL